MINGFKLHDLSIPKILQWILNTALIILAIVLCFLLFKEVYHFVSLIMLNDGSDFHAFLERVLIFFLYFEFIAMIVKYFKENYHFPLRYFLYIGITAVIRLIIVDHKDATNTLYYSIIVLILIISYFIINKTPRERP